MEDIITNEFIAYKTGFVDGKCEVLTQIVENEGTDIFVKETFSPNEKSWYSQGYEDGYNCCLAEYLSTRKLPVKQDRKKEQDTIKEKFTQRVIEFNQETNKEVPAAKFRI